MNASSIQEKEAPHVGQALKCVDSVERDSVERNSVERDSVERNSVERNSVERNSVERNSVERNSVERNKALGEQVAVLPAADVFEVVPRPHKDKHVINGLIWQQRGVPREERVTIPQADPRAARSQAVCNTRLRGR